MSKKQIVETFQNNEWNISQVAKACGVSRQYVQIVLAAEVPDYKEKLVQIRENNAKNKENQYLSEKLARKKKRDEKNLKKMQEVSALWVAGKSSAEISEKIGWTNKALLVKVSLWRKEKPEMFPLRIVSKN